MYVVFEGQRFIRRIVVRAFMLHSSRSFVNPVTFFRLTACPSRVAPTCPPYPTSSRTESELASVPRLRFVLVCARSTEAVLYSLCCILFLPFLSFFFGPFHLRPMRLILSRERAFIHPEWFIPFVPTTASKGNKKTD